MKSKKEAWITIAVFLILVFSLTVWNLCTPDKGFSYNENRQLEQMPEFSAGKLFSGQWQEKFELYLTDQFVGRDTWVSMKIMSERVLQKKDVNGILFADGGYLIQMHTPQDVDQELEQKNLDRLEKFTDRSVDLLGKEHTSVMLVPTAEAILTDKLPPYAQDMLYDQEGLLERAQERMDPEVWIDGAAVMENHKDEYIYYRTDHHWTMNGAFYAYQKWMQEKGYGQKQLSDYHHTVLSDAFLGTTYSRAAAWNVKPDTMLAFEPTAKRDFTVYLEGAPEGRTGLYNRQKLSEKDKYAAYLYGNNGLTEIVGGPRNGRVLLILKDSYAHCFATLAAQDFETVYLIDPRYFLRDIWEFAEEKKVTDTLFLFNAINFVQESKLYILDD